MEEKQTLKQNAKKVKLLFYFLLIFFATSNCRSKDNEEEPLYCGCNSLVINTIPESANLVGKLFYKNDNIGNNYYNHKYWIVYVEPNCINCVHSMIICNKDILKNINNIPSLNPVSDIISSMNEVNGGLDVKFSGQLKKICNPINRPADYTYENITLTKIQIQ